MNGAECHKFGSHAHGGTSQENEPNEDTSMPLSPGTRDHFPASTMAEAPIYTPRTVERELRRERLEMIKDADGVGQTHDMLRGSQREGYRTNPHRIAKPQHYKKKERLKRQQRHLTQVLQGHDEQFRMTPAQREFVNLIDPKGAVLDDVSNTLSAGEGSVISNLEPAIPQLVHDGEGVNMQGGVDQWHTNDEDDDVQTATRKAEEQMRGADDAVNEVYDDGPACETQHIRGDETSDGINNDDGLHIPANTTHDLFPAGPLGPTSVSSIGNHKPMQSIDSEISAEPIDGGTSLLNTRKAIYSSES